MSLERRILVWAAVLAAIGFLLYLLGGAVAPFAAGIALGYLLDPVVQRMQGLGLSRLIASLIILVVFILVAALLLLATLPVQLPKLKPVLGVAFRLTTALEL